jgi:hypothetical protein
MLFNKKNALSISSLILFSLVSACSSNIVPNAVALNGDTSFANSNLVNRISETVTQSKQDPSHFFIDAGKGQKTGASLTVKLNFANGGDFKTKASSNGTPTAMFSDVTDLKVALIDSAASPTTLTGAKIIGGGAAIKATLPRTFTASGDGDTVTFTNVPESTNSYWIAAAALSSGTNITKVSAPLDGGIDGRFYVTTTGGDAALAGSVEVNKVGAVAPFQYNVTSTDALGMDLILRDATGANVESSVTVTNGGDRLTTIGAQ